MYDPMVAKLIVWDADREQATQRMLRALGEYEIEGLKTLIPFHQALLRDRAVGTRRDLPRPARGQGVAEDARVRAAAAGGASRRTRRRRRSSRPTRSRSPGRRFDVRVVGPPFAGGAGAAPQRRGARGRPQAPQARRAQGRGGGGGADTLPSPLQGNMWKVLVKQGDTVEEGQLLCIIEAMKMENEITAHKAGTIVELPIEEGAPIQAGAPIATIISSRRGLADRGRMAALSAWIARVSRRPRAARQLGLRASSGSACR